MAHDEIVLGGFGGQGIILAGYIIGKAAAIFDRKNVTFTQVYGPEARGGACRAQIISSDSPVSYPYIENPSAMVIMSQEAYTKYSPELRSDGLLLLDEDLVQPDSRNQHKKFTIPATRIAREMGRSAVANIVMLGFFTAITGAVSVDSMKKAVLDSVPAGTEELNTKAFERGYAYGLEQMKS